MEVRIARHAFEPTVRRLSTEEAAAALAGYERRHRLLTPLIRALLSRLSGVRYPGEPASRHLVVEALPLLALRGED